MPGLRFVVYTRADCSLCEGFIAELARQLEHPGPGFEVRDVDADPESRRRFGLKVPVLTVNGRLICHGRYDATVVARLLGR